MWRSLFLHEFIDHRVDNFQAIAGTVTPASLGLIPNDDLVPGTNAVKVMPGQGFEYVLKAPVREVIGFSARVRLSHPDYSNPHYFSVLRLGNAIEFLLGVLPGTLRVRARAHVGTSQLDLGQVDFTAGSFTDVRVDWHSSGQARLLANDKLLGYHNAVAPGSMFDIDRIVFGFPNQGTSSIPNYRIARVFVRALTRSDALRQISTPLPTISLPPEKRDCYLVSTRNVLALVDKLRGFMSSVHAILSRPWSEHAGPAAGPFEPQAVTAHALAMESVHELTTMMQTGDFTAHDRFLQPFTAFLRILRDTLPAEFATLTSEIESVEVVPEPCRDAFKELAEQHTDALAPLVTLLAEASERVRQIAGGN